MTSLRLAASALFLSLACVASASAAGSAARFTLTSPAVSASGRIAVKHTCDGAGARPVIKWKGAPKGTKSFVLLIDDPDAVSLNFIKPDDAAGDPFVHWLGWGIPGAASSLSARAPVEGRNDDGGRGWTPFCPKDGVHTFRFRLFALDAAPALKPGASATDLAAALGTNVLGTAKLTGRYGR